MDECRVADYFVVAGLPDNPYPLEEFSNEAAIKTTYKQDPITDIAIINKSIGEKIPRGYICLDRTPTGYPADLNHGSIRCHEMYVCYRRSRDKPPLTDIGVLYEGKERLMTGCEIVHTTFFGSPANVNNGSSGRIYITYRRASENAASDMLAVVELCVILENKSESPPHSYNQISKNLNKGLVGSDVYLCYKKAMTKTDILAYKPAILDRYPAEDHFNFPLPEPVAMFCLPMGASVECWSAKAQHPLPVFSTFILTGIGGEKVYGAAVTFYEEFPEEKLSDLQMRALGLKNKYIREQYRILKTVHSNKSICLLSHWPFFDAFKKFLSYVYKISITGPHTVPLERIISHFMYDVPYPSPQRPRILVQLSHDSLSLSMPEDSPLPQSGASFITMLKNLGPENCMTILLYALHEHKILIHSLRPAVLTSVGEAVASMVFPLNWQCPYIPLCPLGLSDVLSAPTPYIIGLDSRYFDLYDPPNDVICIDLDTIRIWPPEDKKNLSYKMLPKKPAKVLQETLHRLYDRLSEENPRASHTDEFTLELAGADHEFKRKHKEMVLELAIQETFLRFMACLMKGYKQFLKPITNAPTSGSTNTASLFDMQGFMKSRDKANHKFYSQLTRTQLFIRFIEERSFVSDRDAELAFFDECAEKADETKDEPKLIELDNSGKSERTMFILPPEPVGLPDGVKYSYNGFPPLKIDLFLEQKKKSTLTVPSRGGICPNSPVARRTKQEIKTAQKNAQQNLSSPVLWAKCLLTHCYSLWFITLPAFIKVNQSVQKSLSTAYDVLKSMQRAKLKPPDELCYRVLLQLCGQYNQPVLAVKVYWEMKRAGVQPNAITYGYYNKAVLEGRWPSSISKGALLWRKVRNVIIGVAKFRKAIRRRSLSVYSNSGSEFDQLSIDSFLEDHAIEAKHETIMKVESGTDRGASSGEQNGKAVLEEKSSSGLLPSGASDRGYNSMTQEEAKNFSEMISSQDNKGTDHVDSKSKRDWKSGLRFSFQHKHRKKEKDLMEESDDATGQNGAAGKGVDQNSLDQFQARLGGIVRKSGGSLSGVGSRESLRGSMIGSSSAGLLMVGESHDNNIFSQSMGPLNGSESLNGKDSKRKRHKSAGDNYHLKPRSNSMFSNWRHRHVSGEEDVTMKFSDLVAKSKDVDSLEEARLSESGTQLISDMQDISEEIKDSGVALDDTDLQTNSVTDSAESNGLDQQSETPPCQCDSGSQLKLFMSKERSDSLKSNSSSPLHSMPTPVTENDPLGLFIEDGQPNRAGNSSGSVTVTDRVLSSSTSPEKVRQKFVTSRPFADFEKQKEDGEEVKPGQCNTTDKSPESASSKDGEESSASGSTVASVLSPVEKVQRRLFPIERTNSFPANLGATESVKSVWPGRSNSDQSESEALRRSSTSLNEPSRVDGSRVSEFRLFGHRPGSFRRHKENFSGMLKFATGAVANKLSEIKLSMTPSKLGSNNSLTPSVDEWDSGTGDEDSYQDTPRRKSGSLDFLRRSSDNLDGPGTPRSALPPESAPSDPSYLDHLGHLTEVGGVRGNVRVQFAELPAAVVDIALEVEISSCCRCTRCRCLLYDEEIMAGWSADDSNLNTSCTFCNTKLVPHLQIYLKDNRGRKKTKLLDGHNVSEGEEKPASLDGEGQTSPFGKDAMICSNMSGDSQVLFGEDHVDGETSSVKSFESSHDPWMRHSTHSTSEHQDIPRPPPRNVSSDSLNMQEMAMAGYHRRTASECLTSATDNMYGSSVESFDSYTFRALRSPLSISIDEQEPLPTQPSATPETKRSLLDRGPSPLEPISVPYLSPLVLRKELENIIESEGDMSLAADTFVDEHPIIFWNLVWYFKRIQTFSHLPGFLLTAHSFNKNPELARQSGLNSSHVLIRPMWDNSRIHDELGSPMYMVYSKAQGSTTVDALITEAQPFNRAVMHQMITSIQCNDVLTPIKLVMNGRRRFRMRRHRFRSMYREIAFLAFTALGRDNIDHDAFDREYKMAFTRLAAGELKRLQRDDRPRSQQVICCRKVFTELEV